MCELLYNHFPYILYFTFLAPLPLVTFISWSNLPSSDFSKWKKFHSIIIFLLKKVKNTTYFWWGKSSKCIWGSSTKKQDINPTILFVDLLCLKIQERGILGNLLDGERTRIKINKFVLSALHLKDMNGAFVEFIN